MHPLIIIGSAAVGLFVLKRRAALATPDPSLVDKGTAGVIAGAPTYPGGTIIGAAGGGSLAHPTRSTTSPPVPPAHSTTVSKWVGQPPPSAADASANYRDYLVSVGQDPHVGVASSGGAFGGISGSASRLTAGVSGLERRLKGA